MVCHQLITAHTKQRAHVCCLGLIERELCCCIRFGGKNNNWNTG
jgi:hypothetical protein